jgi:ABC-type transport system involved in cytochrome bd biosynthesis fused ATPase/permease subunit
VKSIGYARTGSGSLRAKTFYLGSVEDGQREADRILQAWDALKASGATEWTPEALEALKQSTPVETTAAASMGGTSKTIQQVAVQYIDAMMDRAAKGQVGEGTVVVGKSRIAKVISLIGGTVPMNRLYAEQVKNAVLAICARPMTAHPHRKEQQQMSFDSAKEYKKSFKSFLTWAASTPMSQ